MYVYDHDWYIFDCRTGIKPRKERTRNMARESVTLDESKLSGWLNDDADCRANREQCLRIQGEKGAWREGLKYTDCEGNENKAHPKHVAYACDHGRIEVQRLVKRPCSLPKAKGHQEFAFCAERRGRARRWKWHATQCARRTCIPCL